MNNDTLILDELLAELEQNKKRLSDNPNLPLKEIKKIADRSKAVFEKFEKGIQKLQKEFEDQEDELREIIESPNRTE